MASKKIIIPRDGIGSGKQGPRSIYDESSSKILSAIGKTNTRRASHVEPGSGLSQDALRLLHPLYSERDANGQYRIMEHYSSHWFADMTPTGSDEVLGPYPPEARDNALDDEVNWLYERNIPACRTCADASE